MMQVGAVMSTDPRFTYGPVSVTMSSWGIGECIYGWLPTITTIANNDNNDNSSSNTNDNNIHHGSYGLVQSALAQAQKQPTN